jgi:hypothetical protein
MIAHAPDDLVRMVRLGMMVCQRESDLVRLGAEFRERSGIWSRPRKTKKKRRSFHIPHKDFSSAIGKLLRPRERTHGPASCRHAGPRRSGPAPASLADRPRQGSQLT